MAVATGTATDYKDLLARLRTFLTGLATTATDRPWVSLRYTVGGAGLADELILKAVGTGGTDQIFVGITTFENVTADYYNWRLGGFSGYDNALTFAGQPGVMQGVFTTLWNSPIPYTFVANARRCIIVAKVSSVYVMTYLGFINQYPSPAQYPYPLLIGGNYCAIDTVEPPLTSVVWRWSVADNRNHNFTHATHVSGAPLVNTQMRLRSPAGVWLGLATGSDGNLQDAGSNIWPYSAGMANLQQNLGSAVQSPAFPIILSDTTPEVYGELDGIVATSGQGIAAEDLLTIGTDNWLVTQDVFRTTRERYCAVRKT